MDQRVERQENFSLVILDRFHFDHPERMTSATASISCSLMAGLEKERKEDLIWLSLHLNFVISHLVTRKTARIFQSRI
jgi:hypothetical protein